MDETLVGVLPSAKPLSRPREEFEGLSATMDNAVWCAINVSLLDKAPNVLSLGYSTHPSSSGNIKLDNYSGVYSSFPNTTQNYLLTREWDRVLDRIGLHVQHKLPPHHKNLIAPIKF